MREEFVKYLATVLPVAIFYIVGLLYIDGYTNDFGIFYTEIELTVAEVMISSFAVIFSANFLSSFIFLFIIWVVFHFANSESTHEYRLLLNAIAFLSIFAPAITSATEQARKKSDYIWSGNGPRMQAIVSKETALAYNIANVGLDIVTCAETNLVRIFADKTHTYGLCRSKVRPESYGRVIKFQTAGAVAGTWIVKRARRS